MVSPKSSIAELN